jgi:hypothetical protein
VYNVEPYDDELVSEQDNSESRQSLNPNIGASMKQPSLVNVVFDPIEITPLATVPHSTNQRYLGRTSLHFIKEANLIYDTLVGSAGMGEFTHVFLMEILAVVKAHVLCLGGNAVVGFSLDNIHVTESLKNQGYAMISVSGDVVKVTYSEGRNLDQVSPNIFPKPEVPNQ